MWEKTKCSPATPATAGSTRKLRAQLIHQHTRGYIHHRGQGWTEVQDPHSHTKRVKGREHHLFTVEKPSFDETTVEDTLNRQHESLRKSRVRKDKNRGAGTESANTAVDAYIHLLARLPKTRVRPSEVN